MDYVLLLIWTLVTSIGCAVVESFVNKFYPKISQTQAKYIAKNIVKSGLLTVLGCLTSVPMWNMFKHNIIDHSLIHTFGMMYAIPDAYALFWVPRSVLKMSTVYHHVAVILFAMVNTLIDYETPFHWHGMLIYAYLSMYTGIVNLYLGARFFFNRKSDIHDLYRSRFALAALVIYASSITVNWLIQIVSLCAFTCQWVAQMWALINQHLLALWNIMTLEILMDATMDIGFHVITLISILGYCGALYFIVIDDVVLMKKLRQECALTPRVREI